MLKKQSTAFRVSLLLRSIGSRFMGVFMVMTLSACGGSYLETIETPPASNAPARLIPTTIPGNPLPDNPVKPITPAPSGTPGTPSSPVTPGSESYSVSVRVKGLDVNQAVILENNKNGADQLRFQADGTAAFNTKVANGSRYSVAIVPVSNGNFACSVINGVGVIESANVSVAVECSNEFYTLSATVTGLGANKTVVLENDENVSDQLIFTSNKTATFTTRLSKNAVYDVTIAEQSSGSNCEVSNGKGKISANVTVPVQCSNVPSYTIGASVSGLGTGAERLPIVLKNDVTGESLPFEADGTSTFKTEQASGATYLITIATPPANRVCAISGGSGTVGGANVTAKVTCTGIPATPVAQASGYAYVTNTVSNTVSMYSIGNNCPANGDLINGCFLSNGALTPLSKPTVATGLYPAGIVVNSAGTFAYVVNRSQDSVSMYKIDRTTGILSPLTVSGLSTVGTGSIPVGIAISPNGNFLYVTNTGNPSNDSAIGCDTTQINCNLNGTVSMYTINSQGTLTSIGTKRTSGTLPNIITIDPAGSYAYVTNHGSDSITQFKINGDGSLSYVLCSTQDTGFFPVGMSINPNGKYAYVANLGGHNIWMYSISSRTGKLTPLKNPTRVWTWTPYTIAINPAGTYAYTTNAGTNTVSMYSIDSSGVLNALSSPTIASGGIPLGITTFTLPALGSSSSFVYVVNDSDNSVSMYAIGSNGQLSALSSPTVKTESMPYGIATWRLQ